MSESYLMIQFHDNAMTSCLPENSRMRFYRRPGLVLLILSLALASAGCLDEAPAESGTAAVGTGECVRFASAYVDSGSYGAYAINAAIEAAVRECPSWQQRVVQVDPAENEAGVWWISRTVELKSGVWLRGSGPETILKMGGSRPTAFSVVRALNQTEVLVSDLVVDGNRQGQSDDVVRHQGIRIDSTTHSRVFSVEVKNLQGGPFAGTEAAGINVVTGGASYDAHVEIDDCIAHDIGGYGIGTWNANYVTVRNSAGYGNDSQGISMAAKDSTAGAFGRVENCVAYENLRRGINLENQWRTQVVDSDSWGNGLSNYRTQNGVDLDFYNVSSGALPPTAVDFVLQHPPASEKIGRPHRINWSGLQCNYPCGFEIATTNATGQFNNGCASVFGHRADFCFLNEDG
jgi:hypothetical protein